MLPRERVRKTEAERRERDKRREKRREEKGAIPFLRIFFKYCVLTHTLGFFFVFAVFIF